VELAGLGSFARGHRLHHLAQDRAVGFGREVHEFQRLVREFGGKIEELAGAGVREDHPLAFEDEHRIGQQLDELAVAVFAVDERTLGPLALADVPQDGQGRRPLVVEDGFALGLDVDHRAVKPDRLLLHLGCGDARGHAFHTLVHEGPEVGMDPVAQGRREEIAHGRGAHEAQIGWIHQDQPTLLADCHRVGRSVDELAITFFAFLERLFGDHRLRHHADEGAQGGFAVELHPMRIEFHQAHLAIQPAEAQDLGFHRGAGFEPRGSCGHRLPVIGKDEVLDRAREKVVGAFSAREFNEGAIHEQRASVAVDENAVRGILDEAPVPRLAVAQRGLGRLPLGDVGGENDVGPSAARVEGRGADLGLGSCAVAADKPHLHGGIRFAALEAGNPFLRGGKELGVEELVVGLADDLGAVTGPDEVQKGLVAPREPLVHRDRSREGRGLEHVEQPDAVEDFLPVQRIHLT
jgi:hypothetical protein